MPRIIRATRGLQWLGQWAPTPRGDGNLLNPALVRIEGCNSPSIRTKAGFRRLPSPLGVGAHCPNHCSPRVARMIRGIPVSYTHLRAHETKANLVCRLLLEKKKTK